MTGQPLTLGTAGHVDHGKTALVAALTGTDTDRLPDEKRRGISIELGYAALTLPSGRRLSVVDVPGHERLVRTMVAGATGIDLFLLVVAADDGVMPQTHEHLRVLRALQITRGAVAITKCDVADPARATAAARVLVPDTAIVPVSTRTGAGLDALAAALDRAASGVPGRGADSEPARLHVDRVFTVRGTGTVVTGTLWSGRIAPRETLDVLPADTPVRVRGVEVHGEPSSGARAGQRVAVAVSGPGARALARGDVLVGPGSEARPTYRIDAALAGELDELEPGRRVQVHHGTRAVPARLAWLGGRFWQIRLEQPLVPLAGDRLVVRRIAPPDTLGGGVVLHASPRRHGPSRALTAQLERIARGEPAEPEPPAGTAAAQRTPEAPAPPLSPSALAVEARLRAAGLEPPGDGELDPDALAALRAAGRAVRVTRAIHVHPAALAQAEARIRELGARQPSFTLAEARDSLGTSRKLAEALLQHFDAERLTIRRGDARVLRRRRAR